MVFALQNLLGRRTAQGPVGFIDGGQQFDIGPGIAVGSGAVDRKLASVRRWQKTGDQPCQLGPAQAGHLRQVAPHQPTGFAPCFGYCSWRRPAPPSRKSARDFRLRTGSLRWRLEKPGSDPGSFLCFVHADYQSQHAMRPRLILYWKLTRLQAHLVLKRLAVDVKVINRR